MEVEGAFDTKAIKEEGADTYCAVEELGQTDQTNSPVHLKKPTEAFGMIADVFEFRQNHRRAGARHWNDSGASTTRFSYYHFQPGANAF